VQQVPKKKPMVHEVEIQTALRDMEIKVEKAEVVLEYPSFRENFET
jgi:hypothetical protein